MSFWTFLGLNLFVYGTLLVWGVLRFKILPTATWTLTVGGSSIRIVQRWFRVDVYVDGHHSGGTPLNLEGDTRVHCDGFEVVLSRKSRYFGPDPAAHVQLSGRRLSSGLEVDRLLTLADSALEDGKGHS